MRSPNGVGKSAIALLAYLICAARGLPAVYISRAASWVTAAREQGGGDAFLLDTFWRQNADLIIETPVLRRIFAAALQDAAAPFTAGVMTALRAAVRTPALPGCAVIMDDVQHITQAVQGALVEQPTRERQTAGDYFATNWCDWTNSNSVFQRMSVASAHAERDTKLPDGDAHRLRFIEPLDPADRAALQAAVESPAYVHDPLARERVVYIGGSILRKLITAAQLLPRGRKPSKLDLQLQWQTMWESMVRDCNSWLASLPVAARTVAARTVMDLVTGKVLWGSVTTLYDTGIVYRTAGSPNVRPVSTVAAAVILRVTASYESATRKPLSSISDGLERGFELKRQVLARLDGFAYRHGVPAKLLNGSLAPVLDLNCAYSLPFTHLSEVVEREVPILYRPTSSTYSCDAIRMPAANDRSGSVCFIECSTTDPVLPERVDKVNKWFAPVGMVTQLLARSGRKGTAVLFYDAPLPTRSLMAAAKALSAGSVPPAPAPRPTGAGGLGAGAALVAGAVSGPAPSASSVGAAPPPCAIVSKGASESGRESQRGASAAVLPTPVVCVVCVVDAPSLSEPLTLLL